MYSKQLSLSAVRTTFIAVKLKIETRQKFDALTIVTVAYLSQCFEAKLTKRREVS